MSEEWLWVGAIGGGVAAFMLGVDLLSRWTSQDAATPAAPEEEDEDEGPPDDDVDGTDETITDADE